MLSITREHNGYASVFVYVLTNINTTSSRLKTSFQFGVFSFVSNYIFKSETYLVQKSVYQNYNLKCMKLTHKFTCM